MNSADGGKTGADSVGNDFGEEAALRLSRDDRDRFLCTLFAPAERRGALFALYDFDLEISRVRDTVSDPMVGQLRLKWWYDAVAAMKSGPPPRHAVAEALYTAVQTHGLDVDALLRLIEAHAEDLTPVQPENLDGLAAYAEATTGVVAAMALEILGAGGSEAAQRTASDIAVAAACVRLMRALPQHARRGWVYLPKDLCAAAELALDEVRQMRAGPPMSAVVRPVATYAQERLRAARARRAECRSEALPVLLHGVLADHYLKELQACGYEPSRRRLRRGPDPGPWAMLCLGWRALCRRY